MELTRRLLAAASARPHVLVVTVPGQSVLRRRVEAVLRERGWPLSGAPADADVLLVCGQAGPQLAAAVDVVWGQLPGPRTRAVVTAADDLPATLYAARERLRDLAGQRADALTRTAADGDGGDMGGGDMGGGDMGGGDMGGGDMGGGDMDMDVAGLPMAGSGPDRDGLSLEVLHVQLGPVLPHWPAGLRATASLQGDVVVGLQVEQLDADPDTEADPVHALDRAAALLALAGSPRHARRARALLTADAVPVAVADLRARVSRDRVLRWSLSALPAVGADDLWQRLLDLLDPVRAPEAAVDPADVGASLLGSELTAVRLALSALPPLRSRVPADA